MIGQILQRNHSHLVKKPKCSEIIGSEVEGAMWHHSTTKGKVGIVTANEKQKQNSDHYTNLLHWLILSRFLHK